MSTSLLTSTLTSLSGRHQESEKQRRVRLRMMCFEGIADALDNDDDDDCRRGANAANYNSNDNG